MPDFKPGDVVKLLDCPVGYRKYSSIYPPLPVGIKLLIVDKRPPDVGYVWAENPIPVFKDKTPYLQVFTKYIELVLPGDSNDDDWPETKSTHLCHCPPVNFYWCGEGCKCGGI